MACIKWDKVRNKVFFSQHIKKSQRNLNKRLTDHKIWDHSITNTYHIFSVFRNFLQKNENKLYQKKERKRKNMTCTEKLNSYFTHNSMSVYQSENSIIKRLPRNRCHFYCPHSSVVHVKDTFVKLISRTTRRCILV